MMYIVEIQPKYYSFLPIYNTISTNLYFLKKLANLVENNKSVNNLDCCSEVIYLKLEWLNET